jgi:uncharacterized protein
MFRSILGKINNVAILAIVALINCYRFLLSPYLGENCRFHPNCSCYAKEAVEKHGIFIGCWLASKRIAKCHPFNAGGYDPVPLKQVRNNYDG